MAPGLWGSAHALTRDAAAPAHRRLPVPRPLAAARGQFALASCGPGRLALLDVDPPVATTFSWGRSVASRRELGADSEPVPRGTPPASMSCSV